MRTTILGTLLLLLVLEVSASQLHCRPLAEVIGRARRIMVARVEKVERGEGIVYHLRLENNLLGNQPLGGLTLRYSFPISEVTRPDGTVVRKSLVVDASGHEAEPQPGQSWIFFSDLERGEWVFRVEPLSSQEAVSQLLKGD